MTELIIDHIESDPEKRGGRPAIRGTGITVQDIIGDIRNGMTPDEIAEAFDLTLGQIYAAMSYYYDHAAEIDESIRDTEAAGDQIKAQYRETTQASIQRIKTRMSK